MEPSFQRLSGIERVRDITICGSLTGFDQRSSLRLPSPRTLTWPPLVPRLPISGGRLIKLGMREGPAVARALKDLERAWVAAGFPGGAIFDNLVAEEVARGGKR